MPALLSDSVLIRDQEKLAVVAFTDLTEIAWHTSPDDELLPGELTAAATPGGPTGDLQVGVRDTAKMVDDHRLDVPAAPGSKA